MIHVMSPSLLVGGPLPAPRTPLTLLGVLLTLPPVQGACAVRLHSPPIFQCWVPPSSPIPSLGRYRIHLHPTVLFSMSVPPLPAACSQSRSGHIPRVKLENCATQGLVQEAEPPTVRVSAETGEMAVDK